MTAMHGGLRSAAGDSGVPTAGAASFLAAAPQHHSNGRPTINPQCIAGPCGAPSARHCNIIVYEYTI